MGLDSLLASLHLDVSDVSSVQATVYGAKRCNGMETASIAGVALETQTEGTATHATLGDSEAYHWQAASTLICTAVTAETAENIPSLQQLIDAAMLACNHWCDGDAARQAMRDECANTPLHFRADLLQHFEQTYS